MKKMLNTYGLFGVLQLIIFKFRTKFVFANARIIRFPIRVRGRKLIKVGKGFTTGFNCRIDAYNVNDNKVVINIGNNVQINDYVHIGAVDSISIGDNVLIASKVFITDHNHGNYSGKNQDSPDSIPQERPIYSKGIIIEKNVWLGEFVSVLPGVTIGEGSIIGTMSVVNKSIPPFSIAVGSPAKVIKQFNHTQKKWIKI
ncbi:MAG: acetyltransferase [Polaribacter sp.]|uniref:acetyltransferase n=1 Tax=Polaribacter sp. TaxID=1920175 RepID=UPI002F35E6B1